MKKFWFSLMLFSLLSSGFSFAQDSNSWDVAGEKDWVVEVPSWDILNVRSKPHHKSAKVGELAAGDIVGVLDTDSGWNFIHSKKASGWVNRQYLCDPYKRPECYDIGDNSQSSDQPSNVVDDSALLTQKTEKSVSRQNAKENMDYPSDFSVVDDTFLDSSSLIEFSNIGSQKWGPYDYFYLYVMNKEMSSPAMTVFMMDSSRLDQSLLVKEQYGFIDLSASLVAKNPDWGDEDLFLEVERSQLSQLSARSKSLISHFNKFDISTSDLRYRENKLNAAISECLSIIDSIRPTAQPSNPRKKCVAYIVKNMK